MSFTNFLYYIFIHIHTHTDTHRRTHTDTHRHTHTDTDTHTDTHTQTHTQTHTHTHTHTPFSFGESVSHSRCQRHSPSRRTQSPLLLICQVLVSAPLGGFQNVPVTSRSPDPRLVRSGTVISRHSSSSLPLPLLALSVQPPQGEESRASRLVCAPAGRAPRCPSPYGGILPRGSL